MNRQDLKSRKPASTNSSSVQLNGDASPIAEDKKSGFASHFPFANNMFRTTEYEGVLLFKEQPRQFLFLGVIVFVLSYLAFNHHTDDIEQNIKAALGAICLIFLIYCFLQTRDSVMVRPHPGIWRLVHGAAVLYLLFIAALSVQTVGGAKQALRFLFPDVNTDKEETLPLTCEITPKTLYSSMSSIWFLAHVTGWWGKMCMFRDWRFCWVLSVAFEVIELSLQFIIPEFQECWWDSLFMDLLGANLIGMGLGQLTLTHLETKKYDWSGVRGKKYGFVRRAIFQFSPISWSSYHWEVFSSFKRFCQVIFILVACLMMELNAFFLLKALDIPKESNWNKYRLAIIFMLGLPAAAEFYEFITNPKCWRVGPNAWLMLSIGCVEILAWGKWLSSIDKLVYPPSDTWIPLTAFGSMLLVWTTIFFHKLNSAKKNKTPMKSKALDCLYWISFTPLLSLINHWKY